MLNKADPMTVSSVSTHILSHANTLSKNLNLHMKESFKPDSAKVLRQFSVAEALHYIGTTDTNLRRAAALSEAAGEDVFPKPTRELKKKATYTAEQIHQIRNLMAERSHNPDRFMPGRRDGDHLQVIVTANFKGGSGKTTSSIMLAQGLAMMGYRVLGIDMDPQASFTMMFGHRPEMEFAGSGTIYDALRYTDTMPISSVIRKSHIPNLDYVPAGLLLTSFESETAQVLLEGISAGHIYFDRLSHALEEVDSEYDVVVIDSPPQIGYLTQTALGAATGVIITCVPSMLDVASMAQFLSMSGSMIDSIERLSQGRSMRWDFMRYLISRYDPNATAQHAMVGFLTLNFPDSIYKSQMLNSAGIVDALNTQETIIEIEPSKINRNTYKRATDMARDVLNETHQLIQGSWGRAVAKKGEE